jgi:hypothetical protein
VVRGEFDEDEEVDCYLALVIENEGYFLLLPFVLSIIFSHASSSPIENPLIILKIFLLKWKSFTFLIFLILSLK